MMIHMMAALYIVAGILHFLRPWAYLKIMPPYIPYPRLMNYLSGVAEIMLGILLFIPKTQSFAAWGIIALLIAVMPANIYMYQQRATLFRKIPSWILLLRLPFQFVLIAWAYAYT